MPAKTKSATKPKASIQPITSAAADTHEAREYTCATRAASKLDLINLTLDERAFLATCQEIYRNNNGCYTPFESFFDDLVRFTRWGNPPTLESLRLLLSDADGEFVSNWEGLLHGVKRFVRNYPDLIAELQNAAKSEVEQPAEASRA